MSIEAMKQALDALKAADKGIIPGGIGSDERSLMKQAINALRRAIKQEDHVPDTTKMMPTGKDSLQVEAMKQALDALALFASDESDEGQVAIVAHEELRQAIEQAEKDEADFQDFVAQLQKVEKEACEIINRDKELKDWEAIAADQAMTIAMLKQREWVGLTDEDMHQLRKEGHHYLSERDFRAIEAKLREKNVHGWQSVANPTEYLDDLRGGADEL